MGNLKQCTLGILELVFPGLNERYRQQMISATTGTVLWNQEANVRRVQGADLNAVVSRAKHEESSSEAENPEIQADDPKVAVIGEGKATEASDAVLLKNTTGSFAFLDVKRKIMEGKAEAQDITKALDDAMKTADSEYENVFHSQPRKQESIPSRNRMRGQFCRL